MYVFVRDTRRYLVVVICSLNKVKGDYAIKPFQRPYLNLISMIMKRFDAAWLRAVSFVCFVFKLLYLAYYIPIQWLHPYPQESHPSDIPSGSNPP